VRDLQHQRRFTGRDSNQNSIGQNKFDGIAAAESDAGEANAPQAAKCGWPNGFGFSSENSLHVLSCASLFSAFRAWLEIMDASRHAFKKQQKTASSRLEQMDNPGTIHRLWRAVYK
jgi:hypothetical protein